MRYGLGRAGRNFERNKAQSGNRIRRTACLTASANFGVLIPWHRNRDRHVDVRPR